VKYHNELQGFNSRLDELQAALLGPRVAALEGWNARRSHIARRYLEGLRDTGLVLPATLDGNEHTWHLFVVRSRRRDELQRALTAAGIGTMIHYPVPPHLQPAYQELGYRRGDFPVSEAIHDEILSLPMGPHLDDTQVDYVIDTIRKA
jgi:dTDP-4-amino-4,6-dideoxygalactose transaminase